MYFFELMLSPFLLFIEQVFLLSFNLTHSYGVAILLLSFAVSLLLLPVFIFIEKAKRKDDAIKFKMKPFVDEIKRVYKGQERFYYLKTINRQFHYSPFRALIPILSLLIQIPFFIAAYQFLEGFTALSGVSFGPVKDLSQVDGLIRGVNFLPILMTAVNLITAWFYTRLGDGSERKQMLIVAAAFLVLLYKLPSGLLLYWTMNNVFSFLRLFITNPEVFRNFNKLSKSVKEINNQWIETYRAIPKLLKIIYVVFFTIVLISQLFPIFQNGFMIDYQEITFTVLIGIMLGVGIIALSFIYKHIDSILAPLQVKPSLFFILLFGLLYFFMAGVFYFKNQNSNFLFLSFALLIPSQLIAIMYLFKSRSKFPSWVFQGMVFLVLFIGIFEMGNFLTFLRGKEISISLFKVIISFGDTSIANVISAGIAIVVLLIPAYLSLHKITWEFNVKYKGIIYLLSIGYVVGMVFLWNPLLVFSSSPESFDIRGVNILNSNYTLFLGFFLGLLTLYFISPRKTKQLWLFIALVLVFVSFIYSSIIPINLGSLQESRFAEQEKLAAPGLYYLLEFILLVLVFVLVKTILQKKYSYYVITALLLLNVFLVANSILHVNKSGSFFASDDQDVSLSKSEEVNTISFSKHKQNTIYYLADGFQGWFIKKILENNTQFKNELEGFVWYPNTISESNYTHSSLPALLGGYDYTVSALNSQSDIAIKTKIKAVSMKFLQKAKDQNYSFTSTNMHYANIDKSQYDNYILKWQDSWEKEFPDLNLRKHNNIWSRRLYENAIFYSVPLFLKPKIYNNQQWFNFKQSKQDHKVSLKNYNFVRALPALSVADSSKGNFIYIHDHSLHNPWNIVNKNGDLIQGVTPYKNNEWFIEQFVKWVQWMKANGVYDNTRIVIVSDHGPTWDQYDGDLKIDAPIVWDESDPNKIAEKYFWRLNALLMVKDFEEKGELSEDWSLMSNVDAPYFVFGEDIPTIGDTVSRKVNTTFTLWTSHMIEQNTMKVHKQFEISNNIFDLNNWESTK